MEKITLSSLEIPQSRALMAVFYGQAGAGKTSLASTFPNIVWLPVENPGPTLSKRSDIAMFPSIEYGPIEIMQVFDALLKDKHNFKTLVIDSVTKLHAIFEEYVVKNDPKKPTSIKTAEGGWGAGHAATAKQHLLVSMMAEELAVKKGMNVIFLAHADTETISPPDGESYTRYTLSMHKDSAKVYIDNCDLVGFLKQETFITKEKAVTSTRRLISCYLNPSNVSKNRFSKDFPWLNQDVTFTEGINPFKEILQNG